MRNFASIMLMVSALLVSFVSTTAMGVKSVDDYWEDVGLPFSTFSRKIGPDCNSSFVKFYACVEGLSGALSRAEPELTLMTKSMVKNQDHIFADLGNVVISEIEESSEESTLAELKAEKEARISRIESFRKYYENRKVLGDLPFKKVLAFITENMIDGNPDIVSVLTADAINAMLSAENDPHTYITPMDYFFDRDGNKEIFGIGVKIRIVNGRVLITNPVEGSPAHKAGIKARDVITHVNGKLLRGASIQKDVNKISGPRGTRVVLSVRRGAKSIEFKIVREKIAFKNVTSRTVTDTGHSVGYIRISSFLTKSACREVKIALGKFKNIDGLVLDLRGNVGGYLSEGVCVADLFLPKGKKVLTQKNLDGSPSTEFFSKTPAMFTKAVTVLIDAESASASEIVAGALQDYGRTITVGVRSYGKGTVQKPDYWKEGEGVIFAKTVARFYLPSGRTNQIHGITPDLNTYASPTPTEHDKFFVREGDQYLNPLEAVGKPWKQTDKKKIAKVKKIKGCVEKSSQPQKIFYNKKNETFAPDYQLIYAQKVVSCST